MPAQISSKKLSLTHGKKQSEVKKKYLSQLTLQVIESEGVDTLEMGKLNSKRFQNVHLDPEESPVPEQIEEELHADESKERLKEN